MSGRECFGVTKRNRPASNSMQRTRLPGRSPWERVSNRGGRDALVAVRLKVDRGKIAEIEQLYDRTINAAAIRWRCSRFGAARSITWRCSRSSHCRMGWATDGRRVRAASGVRRLNHLTVVQISEKPEGVSFSPWEKVAPRSASPTGRSLKKAPDEGQD